MNRVRTRSISFENRRNHELKKTFTIVIVTHNMQQAVRVSDMTAFFNAEAQEVAPEK